VDKKNSEKWIAKTILPPLITGIFILITALLTSSYLTKEQYEADLIIDLLPKLTSNNEKENKYALYALKVGIAEDRFKDFVGLVATEYANEIRIQLESKNLKGAREIIKKAAYVDGIVYDRTVEILKEQDESMMSKLLCHKKVPIIFATTSGLYTEYTLIEENCPSE